MIGNLFDGQWYLHNNPDVAAAVRFGLTDAVSHHHDYGRFEGRSPSHLFDPGHYLAHNPDVRAAVDAGLVTAYDHFLLHGLSEGRSFVPYFDVDFYLQSNPDVDAAVGGDLGGAVAHFLLHGQTELRPLSPFFDMGAYLQANPDLAAMVEQMGGNPLQHLLFHGYGEPRDLGNGVNLAQFAYDPIFQAAQTPFEALARVAAVSPFLPTFNPPEGWEAPADTPIPIDFVPLPGEKLVVPPSVKIPDGMELPDTFEPVNPEPRPSPDPSPGPKPDPEPEGPFKAYIDDADGVIRFENVQDGEVEFQSMWVNPQDEEVLLLVFKSGTQRSTVEFTVDCGCPDLSPGIPAYPDADVDPDFELELFPAFLRIELQKDETLVAQPELLSFFSVNKVQMLAGSMDEDSRVGIRVDMGGVPAPEAHLAFDKVAALVLSSLTDGVDELHVDLNDSIVILAPDAEYNLLTYDEEPLTERGLKSLKINASGSENLLYLGNELFFDIGYYLGDVEVTGSGDLVLLDLQFGSEGTVFDATKSTGDIALLANVYNGFEHDKAEYDWNIQFGDGDDVLAIDADGKDNHPYPGKFGSFIDGGGGRNTLELDADVYESWAHPDADAVPEDFKYKGKPIVENFQVLVTEAIDEREYESNLLGNQFDSIELYAWGSASNITVESGFSTVAMYGAIELDASALQGTDADIYVKSLDEMAPYGGMELFGGIGLFDGMGPFVGGAASVKVVDLNAVSDDPSGISIILSNHLDISTFTVENMRVSVGDDSQNDSIDFSAWGMDKDAFMGMNVNVEVSNGAVITTGGDELQYVNFLLEFDRDEYPGADFTLLLKNAMTRDEYNDMLLDGGADIELLGALVEEGAFIL